MQHSRNPWAATTESVAWASRGTYEAPSERAPSFRAGVNRVLRIVSAAAGRCPRFDVVSVPGATLARPWAA